jgi:hypothetical protein
MMANCSHEFVLIDLYSQRHAVLHCVHGLSKEDILMWLGQHGSVAEIPLREMTPWQRYVFESFCCPGLRTVFSFDGDPAKSERHGIVVIY